MTAIVSYPPLYFNARYQYLPPLSITSTAELLVALVWNLCYLRYCLFSLAPVLPAVAHLPGLCINRFASHSRFPPNKHATVCGAKQSCAVSMG